MQKYARAAEYGERITQVREQKGWSQRELARRTGFSNQQISKVETGAVNTPVETIARIAEALEVPMAALVEPYRDDAHTGTLHAKEVLSRLAGLADEIAHLQALFHDATPHPQKGHKSYSSQKQGALYQKDPMIAPKWYFV